MLMHVKFELENELVIQINYKFKLNKLCVYKRSNLDLNLKMALEAEFTCLKSKFVNNAGNY